MIWLEWHDPNFIFSALDKKGRSEERFCYAESEEQLIERIKKHDLELIGTIKPYDFSKWRERAKRAKERAIADYKAGKRPINFNEKIWKDLKWHLFGLSHDKCAYCESEVGITDYGQVEHYRPKGKVEEDPKRGDDPGHPGYYWLAYDEKNLLPSCGLCNGPDGKMAHFPVLGTHARDPQGLAQEQPLLLNPYNREINPFEHLEFTDIGVAVPYENSSYGQNSKHFYNLNRSGISGKRHEAIIKVQKEWDTLTGIFSTVIRDETRKNYWREVLQGRRAYSAAQVWELYRITQRKISELHQITRSGDV